MATLVCLHPLPTHGGMMDSHVFRKAAWRLPALAGLAVLRFNTRGTSSVRGASEGSFSAGVDGAKHLWVGEKYVRIVLSEIVRTVNPAALHGAAALPAAWDG